MPSNHGKNWESAPLHELTQYIVSAHHQRLKSELRRLNQCLNQAITGHGDRDGAMIPQLPGIFGELWEELEAHMQREELILFPTIERDEAAAARGRALPRVPFGSIRNPIRLMGMEHESAEKELLSMRRAACDYCLPEQAGPAFRDLFEGLREMEDHLHTHLHLENGILFPRAIALEVAQPRG